MFSGGGSLWKQAQNVSPFFFIFFQSQIPDVPYEIIISLAHQDQYSNCYSDSCHWSVFTLSFSITIWARSFPSSETTLASNLVLIFIPAVSHLAMKHSECAASSLQLASKEHPCEYWTHLWLCLSMKNEPRRWDHERICHLCTQILQASTMPPVSNLDTYIHFLKIHKTHVTYISIIQWPFTNLHKIKEKIQNLFLIES